MSKLALSAVLLIAAHLAPSPAAQALPGATPPLCLVAQFPPGKAYAVALYGDTLAIAQPGIVRIYELQCGAWVPTETIQSTWEGYGHSVALGYNLLAVSAPPSASSGGIGSVFMYERNEELSSWEIVNHLAPPYELEDGFGMSLAVAPGIVAVGAPFDSEAGPGAGAVHIFQNLVGGGGWTHTKKIIGSDTAAEDLFGYALALDGGASLAVLAPFDDDGAPFGGVAFTFGYGSGLWPQTGKIVPSTALADEPFVSIDIEYSTLVMGRPTLDASSSLATIFRLVGAPSVWTETQTIQAPDVAFGNAVAISGPRILVGANGGLHVFSAPDPFVAAPWVETDKIDDIGVLAAYWDRFVLSDGFPARLYSFNPADCRSKHTRAPLPTDVKHY